VKNRLGTRASALFDSKSAAVEEARCLARARRPSRMLVFTPAGRVESEETF
jgi:hypothetical protein